MKSLHETSTKKSEHILLVKTRNTADRQKNSKILTFFIPLSLHAKHSILRLKLKCDFTFKQFFNRRCW